jgi:hypothetical protein
VASGQGFGARDVVGIIRSHAIFTVVTTLVLFSFGKVPVRLAAAIVALEIIAVFAYGVWVGRRWPGRSTWYYFLIGAGLGLLLFLAQAVWGSIRFGEEFNTSVLFGRVVPLGTLLCAGGAILGDMSARRNFSFNSATVGTFAAVAGVVVALAQLFA